MKRLNLFTHCVMYLYHVYFNRVSQNYSEIRLEEKKNLYTLFHRPAILRDYTVNKIKCIKNKIRTLVEQHKQCLHQNHRQK